MTSLKPPASPPDAASRSVLNPRVLGVARQHLVEVAGEEGGLVAAGAGAHLDDDVLLVGRVSLEHLGAQLLLELGQLFARLGQLVLRHLADLLVAVAEQLLCLQLLRRQLAPAPRQVTRRRQLLVLAGDLGVAPLVRDQRGIAQLLFQLGEAAFDFGDEWLHPGGRIPTGLTGPGKQGANRCPSPVDATVCARHRFATRVTEPPTLASDATMRDSSTT